MRASLQHLSGRVWIHPADPDPDMIQGSVAVIADDAGSTLVDAGHSPDLARHIRKMIAQAGLPPVRRLVYTHHHWDHAWGACAWEDVEIIGHALGYDLMAAEALRPWSPAYLREQIAANSRLGPSFRARARAVQDWDPFTIVPASRTFTDRLTLTGGIQVRHLGGHHAPDSTVVAVPDSGVMLLGDCFYPPSFHLRRPGDGVDPHQIEALIGEGFAWYVDSHNPPWRPPR